MCKQKEMADSGPNPLPIETFKLLLKPVDENQPAA